jgi:hypothetical protein
MINSISHPNVQHVGRMFAPTPPHLPCKSIVPPKTPKVEPKCCWSAVYKSFLEKGNDDDKGDEEWCRGGDAVRCDDSIAILSAVSNRTKSHRVLSRTMYGTMNCPRAAVDKRDGVGCEKLKVCARRDRWREIDTVNHHAGTIGLVNRRGQTSVRDHLSYIPTYTEDSGSRYAPSKSGSETVATRTCRSTVVHCIQLLCMRELCGLRRQLRHPMPLILTIQVVNGAIGR